MTALPEHVLREAQRILDGAAQEILRKRLFELASRPLLAKYRAGRTTRAEILAKYPDVMEREQMSASLDLIDAEASARRQNVSRRLTR